MSAPAITAEVALRAAPIHGEGPWWDGRAGVLWWVDILAMEIHRSDPATGSDACWRVPEHVGAVVGRSSGGAVALLQSGFAAIDERGDLTWLAQVEAHDATTRFNDGKCDPLGRLVGGTLSYLKTRGAGSLYRLDVDHSVTRLLTGLTLSNGLAWSPDGETMYLIDSGSRSLKMYGYDDDRGSDGHLTPRDEIALGPGVPDGMTIDSEGCLWVAMYGAGLVRRFTPKGQAVRQVVVPATGVTSCIFGGSRLDQLYVTTSSYSLSAEERRAQPDAGSIFVCAPGVSGRPEPFFAG